LPLTTALLLVVLSVWIRGGDGHDLFSFRISIKHLSFGCSVLKVPSSVLISFILGSFSKDLCAFPLPPVPVPLSFSILSRKALNEYEP
ncbi:MAG: hypothetical protein ACRD5J_17720, partial [Nitrososphaeraceae archaeon]